MNVTTRRAQEADLDALVPLFDSYRQFYQQPSQPLVCREFLRARLQRAESALFLAEGDPGDAIGFAQLYPMFSSVQARPVWLLNDLFVRADARGHGAGRRLLDAARDHAVATGAAWLVLETTAENRDAQALYERYGYVRLDPDSRFYRLMLQG